jgi:hypothetical protein
MSDNDFEIGNDVSFPGGEGQVVGFDNCDQRILVNIQTRSGQFRVIPSDLACLKRI